MKTNKIFLVGMPASGKSTIGKLLANQLRLNYFDLDKIIVEHEGMAITEIFEENGEEYFRELERKCLIEFIDSKQEYVLATGGGAPCFFRNMEVMNENGLTVFLNVDISDLYKKLASKDNYKRPLLKDKTPDQIKEELYSKYSERVYFYKQAKICLDQRLSDINNRVNQVIFAIKTLEN